MFAGGVRPRMTGTPPSTWYTSLISLVEQADAAPPYDNGSVLFGARETPCSGMAAMITQLITAENGAPAAAAHRILTAANGIVGVPIANLVHSSSSFFDIASQVDEGFALAQALGLRLSAPAWIWTQGTSDQFGTTRATYRGTFKQLCLETSAQLKAEAVQDRVPVCLVGQSPDNNLVSLVQPPNIALAQMDVAEAIPALCSIATPMYLFVCFPGSLPHLLGTSSRWYGAYQGIAYKRRIYDGDTAWSCLKITSAVRDATGITLGFHVPVPPLVLDSSWCTEVTGGGKGLQVVDNGGTPVALTGPISVIDSSHLRVPCVNGGGVGSQVRSGWWGDDSTPGPATGPRTNIRDSQGDSITFEVEPGDVRRMDNYLAVQEVATTS